MALLSDFSWWNDVSRRTFFLVNFATIVEGADEALLPSVYLQVGKTFNATPSDLGTLTLVRSLTQALSFPVAAYLAIRYPRMRVIIAGVLIWAIATSVVAFASQYSIILVARAVNGIGLALVTPAIQSLVADTAPAADRGVAFGVLSLTGNIGGIIGVIFGVVLAGIPFKVIEGWRLAFHAVAIISYITAFVLWRYGSEPTALPRLSAAGAGRSPWEDLHDLVQGSRQIFGVRTFQIIVAQGIAGSFPWAAMAFAAMWLELLGFSNVATAVLLGIFAVFNAGGSLFGGWFGDKLAYLYPDSGRTLCAQFSVGMAIPLSALLLRVVPPSTSYIILYSALLALTGFVIPWCASGTNNPIFAEIVPEKLRTSVYALDRTFEKGIAAFAPATVGILAEQWFGYKAAVDASNVSGSTSNAEALSQALFTAVALPFFLCFLIYFLLYWTYPKDRDRATEVLPQSPIIGLHTVIDGEDDPRVPAMSSLEPSPRITRSSLTGASYLPTTTLREDAERML